MSDFLPSANWERLRLRARLLASVREFFAGRGFLEVETPLLSADVVIDRHLDPIGVVLPDDARAPERGRRLWLQTSPEFAMKRLLAAGGEAIYQVTRAFRSGEQGRLHNPEFTMVEWYRRGHTPVAAMQLLSDLAEALLGLSPAEQITYAAAFAEYVGVDPHRSDAAALERRATELASRSAGSREAAAAGRQPPTGLDRDGWLDWLLTEYVEPHLGSSRPTILCDYPASQAALAQVAGDPPVAQRFELYVRGIELANGYRELLDPGVLRARNAAANRQRAADGKPALPGESRLLAAMDHGLPESCGVALGFDRVVMLAAGASSLAEVMAFPVDRA